MNQCDGCARNYPVAMGIHIDFEGNPYMCCSKSEYVNNSSNHPHHKINTFTITQLMDLLKSDYILSVNLDMVEKTIELTTSKLGKVKVISNDLSGSIVFDSIDECLSVLVKFDGVQYND